MNLKPTAQQKITFKQGFNRDLKFHNIILAVTSTTFLILGVISFSTSNNYLSSTMLLIIGAGFLVIIGLGLHLKRQTYRRIDQIIHAAEQVTQGNLNVRIDDDRHDEVGRLAQAFNQIVADVDRLYHNHNLLSRTMSPAVRQSLMDRGLDFRGIAQEVSILFVDIRDFTAITEKHNTEQLVFFLNDYYTTIANQVHSGGGIIGKYAGDSILAYFGAPNPEPASKSSTSALLTALALQEAISKLSQRWTFLGLPPIRIGIGISIGQVIAGPIGSEQQFEYTVIGDVVNLASRLQDLTRNVPGYDIILSIDVYTSLEERIQQQIQVISLPEYETMDEKQRSQNLMVFVDFGEVSVKGKKGLTRVYGIPG